MKNRITMAPMFGGYTERDGTVNQLVLDHYREMAASGVAMVLVENVSVDPSGAGSPFMLRVAGEKRTNVRKTSALELIPFRSSIITGKDFGWRIDAKTKQGNDHKRPAGGIVAGS